MRRDTRPNACAACRGIRAGHEWIRPKINIEQCALRALEEDVLPVAHRAIQQRHRVRNKRPQLTPAFHIFIVDLREAQRFRAERLEDLVVFLDLSTQFPGKPFSREQIDQPQTRARDLIRIGWADAAFGRADLAFAFLFLADFVEQLVVREHQMCRFADIQIAVDAHAAFT